MEVPDLIVEGIKFATGIAAGALSAYLANRIVNAEMWGHIKQHCREHEKCEKEREKMWEAIHKLNNLASVFEYQCEQDRQRDKGR